MERENGELSSRCRHEPARRRACGASSSSTWQERTPQFVAIQRAGRRDAPEVAAADDAGQEVGQDLSMSARWNNGLELATKDKAFRVHVGGRWQFDTSWFSADPEVQQQPAGRRAVSRRRRFPPGPPADRRHDVRAVIEFAMEYDFVNGFRERQCATPAFSDINVTAADRPVAAILAHADRQPPHRQPEGSDRLRAHRQQPVFAVHGAVVQPGHVLRRVVQRLYAGGVAVEQFPGTTGPAGTSASISPRTTSSASASTTATTP